MRTDKLSLLTSALLFAGGIFFSYILFGYFYQNTHFFEVRLVEAVQIISIWFVALFVVRAVNTQLNNNVKKRELLSNLIDAFQCKIADIYSFLNEKASNLTGDSKRKIKLDFTDASNLLLLLREAKKSQHCDNILKLDDNIINDFNEFKISVTDPQYVQKKPVYDEARMTIVLDKYKILSSKVFNCKLSIYTE